MHGCLNQVIEHFSPKQNQPTTENLASNPAKLCFVVKQSMRDAAVGENLQKKRNKIVA